VSLRRRVLLGCLAVAVVLLAADASIIATSRQFVLGRVDHMVAETAMRLAVDQRMPGGGGPFVPPRAPGVGEGRIFSDLYIGVLGAGETEVVRAGPSLREYVVPPKLAASDVRRQTADVGEQPRPTTVPSVSGGGSWRVAAVTRPGGDILVVGASLGDAEATLHQIRLVVLLASATVLLTLLAFAVWVLRLGVSPLAAMADTAGAIAAGDLSRRVEPAGGPTEAGQLGSALNRMLEQIEEAFRVKGESEDRLRQFIADASHELRTPLTSIRGYAELWRQGGLQSPEELADAMRRMEEEARRMGALVDDLLLLARLDEGRPMELATVRLDLLVADAVRDARAVEPSRPIDLDAEPALVLGDEHRLRQVVGNLLANVRVHTPAGTPVHVTIGPRDGQALLEVADEGPGLTPDVAQRVFERFFRGDASRTRSRGGTGLGLSIVAAVAEAHGGRVAVETAPGRGARFIVEVPLHAAAVTVTASP
jgi:two-component system OmpR family sensor kinase